MDQFINSGLRRKLLLGAAGTGSLAVPGPLPILADDTGSSAALGFPEIPDGAFAKPHLYVLPGKVPLIKKTYRSPNFETPIKYIRTPITPSNLFFMRCDLAAIAEV